jgi:hypothetical protein
MGFSCLDMAHKVRNIIKKEEISTILPLVEEYMWIASSDC